MQIIPADWQNTVEDLYQKIREADDSFLGLNKDRHLGAAYISACENFMVYINQTFGSSNTFDDFLKSDLLFDLNAKGYDSSIPEDWDDGYFSRHFKCASDEAEDVWVTYSMIYQKRKVAIPFLPSEPNSSGNTVLMSPHI